MGWWGKLAGGAFGFLLGGPLGALLGAALGHNFDKGLKSIDGVLPGEAGQERIQSAFFTATFALLGHLAKADGRVSRAEIAFAEQVMRQLSLEPAQREVAIALFNEGKQAGFPLDGVLAQFRHECRGRTSLIQMFIEILAAAAWADGEFSPAEERVLQHIRRGLRVSDAWFDEILRRVEAAHQGAGATKNDLTLERAYAILGVTAEASDAEIKTAYRRLLNQHHPDKLVSKGLPEEMMAVAARKTHEIKQAYETIKARRAST